MNHKPISITDCFKWSLNIFYQNYNYDIKTLLEHYPSDHKTSEGQLFWSAGKKCPKIIDFDINNQYHCDFVNSCAFLWAKTWNLIFDFSDIKDHISNINMDSFQFTVNKPAITEDEAKKNTYVEEDPCSVELISEWNLNCQEFEKDDDKNGHIMFITSTSNMRALNYDIIPENFYKTKKIAGKIIPAIATTTSLVAGLISLEIYKIVSRETKIENYRNYFVNLALPLITYSDPVSASVYEINNNKFTMWDNFDFTEDCLMEKFINYWNDKLSIEIEFVACGSALLYFNSDCDKKRNLSDLVKERTGKNIFEECVQIIVSDSNETEVPVINLFVEKRS